MAKKVVIVGGGVAGSIVANRLARSAPQALSRQAMELVLISNTADHIYQPGFLFISFDTGSLEQFTREEQRLLHPRVQLIVNEVTGINPARNQVITTSQTIDYDFLVIATGSVPDFESVPGLAAAAHDFYTPRGAELLRDALLDLETGTILMTIDVPHKCPVAPLEWMFMADDLLRERGVRERVNLKYTYPIGRVHSLEPVARWAEQEFSQRGIETEVFFNLERVDPEQQLAYNMDGTGHHYDLLVSIPAHQGVQVIRDSGLGDADGFIPTDRYTLQMQGSNNIYVLGDATDLPVSKAGSTAHYQAEIVVKNLISQLQGRKAAHRYNGKAFCFIESGLNAATYIWFDYQTPPQPVPPSELLHWFKLSYNELYWLSAQGII